MIYFFATNFPVLYYLGDNSVKCIDQHKVINGRRMWIQTDLQDIIVVWGDPEAGHETVYVQIQILSHNSLSPRERFCGWWGEQKILKGKFHKSSKIQHYVLHVFSIFLTLHLPFQNFKILKRNNHQKFSRNVHTFKSLMMD